MSSARPIRVTVVAALAVSLPFASLAAAAALPAQSGAAHVATAAGTGKTKPFKLTDVKHVFDIVLENKDYGVTFGDASADPYLATKLPAKGLLLKQYYSTGHASNDNYISLISGQAPNSDNQEDCQVFTNFPTSGTTANEPDQQSGLGCVYPTSIGDIGKQLSTRHLSWKGYMQDMGNVPSRESAACGHPAIAARDNTQEPVEGDGYVTRHDPFVYFHQVIDNQKFCDTHVQALGSTSGVMPKKTVDGVQQTGLATDLGSIKSTPNYSFITPNLCYDGHDYPCTNQKSGKSAVADIDTFLHAWVPMILHSPAFKKNGLLEITFDESDGSTSDSRACCNEASDPNAVARNGRAGLDGPGGGRIGALLFSPFIKPGKTSKLPYNHYSTLRTNEDIFGLPALGYATTAKAFATKLFRMPKTSAATRVLSSVVPATVDTPAVHDAAAVSGAKPGRSSGGDDVLLGGIAAAALVVAGGGALTLRRRRRS